MGISNEKHDQEEVPLSEPIEHINILVVDDEQIVLDSIKKHLKSESECRVYTAPDVHTALSILKTIDIQIVLTDLMMPEIDGLELLKMLRDKMESIIAIMITGYATINTALQAQQLGAFDYIAKPFTREELKKVIRRAIALAIASRKVGKSLAAVNERGIQREKVKSGLKGIGEHSWFMRDEDGVVLIGVERAFLYSIGKIHNIYLPAVGDELRQGSVYFQIFSADLRSETLLSPLSGMVSAVNEELLDNPDILLDDPYGRGWLVKLSPNKFDDEIKIIGL